MRKLNFKNKFFIIIFALIILGIVAILISAIKLTGSKTTSEDLNSNAVVFSTDSNIIDTSNGGKIERKWNGEYYYLSGDNSSYSIGNTPIIYNKLSQSITLYGTNYQISSDGSVAQNNESFTISDTSTPYFFKLDDRVYLITADEIYNLDKSIYASKYLIVSIDKQGNASVLNDTINIKTINPMNLIFGDYTFDIANEKLIIGNISIDLKKIIGSTNEYVQREETEKEITYDSEKLIDSYNKLVSDFTQYAKNHQLGANNQVTTTNNIVVNGSNSNAQTVTNKTNITKRVSLRGAISYPTYIDVTYIVTDPEEKYQAVYLLVTGLYNDEITTQKIILDKYATAYRIKDLEPNNEYTISLGYIEVKNNAGEKSLVDNIEDVINVRTTKVDYTLKIEKISSGAVYFNYKMPSTYAFESATIGLYVDGNKIDGVDINYNEMISKNGFSSKINLFYGSVYELRVENARYNGDIVDTDISKKFTISV